MAAEIRRVRRSDTAAITDIYNWYIANTVITFEVEPVTEQDMQRRIDRVDNENPWLVMVEGDKLLGYAYAVPWKARSAYRYSKETTVYLHRDCFGQGHGTQLMQSLIEEICKTPIHVLIAGIALPNEGSVALHEKLGFRKIGQFEEVGFKFNKPVDVGYWQLTL